MHSPKSGHLLVYCNSKIILIDFHILENKSYSLFIDEQLCEILIEKHGEDYQYGFEINTKADTPLNRARKKMEKKHLMQSLLFAGGLILMVALFSFGMNKWNNIKDKAVLGDRLTRAGLETKARILETQEGQDRRVSYFFLVDGKAYTIKKDFPDDKPIILETGMPLEAGDEFVVRYMPTNPKAHVIDYKRPTPDQIKVYHQRAVDSYINNNPEADTTYVNCLAEVAYDMKGLSAYADFYFLNTSPSSNPTHNTDSFNRLVRDIPLKEKVQEKCVLFR